MHATAENGIASHWQYKGGNKGAEEAERFRWLKQLVEWVQEMNDPSEFIDSVKEDLFEQEVFVFSPNGQLFALAKGSSVLDFAYRVHSDLGDHCIGAKINGRMVPIRHTLQNGDTIEILSSSDQRPRREWLNFVRTSKARAKIRQWLKKEQRHESISIGRGLLEKELKQASQQRQIDVTKAYRAKLGHVLSTFDLRDEDHLYSAIGYGQISLASVINEVLGISSNQGRTLSRDEVSDAKAIRIIKESAANRKRATPPPKDDGIIVGSDTRNVLLDFCGECCPLIGDEIKGVITRGRGIKIHRLGCKYLLESDEERRLDAGWDKESTSFKQRAVHLDVICEDSPGMLASMSKAISSSGFNIGSVVLKKLSNNRGLAKFEVMLATVEDLERVITQLQQEQGVISVERR